MSHDFSSLLWFGERIARPVLVYAGLIMLLRVFGKRELAQLNPFDIVVLMMTASTVQNAILGTDTTLVGGLVAVAALFAANYLTIRFLFRHRRLDQMVEGKPVALIENGRVRERNVAKELMTRHDLAAVARRQLVDLEDVERMVLQSDGQFEIKLKPGRESKLDEVLRRLEELQKDIRILKSAS